MIRHPAAQSKNSNYMQIKLHAKTSGQLHIFYPKAATSNDLFINWMIYHIKKGLTADDSWVMKMAWPMSPSKIDNYRNSNQPFKFSFSMLRALYCIK